MERLNSACYGWSCVASKVSPHDSKVDSIWQPRQRHRSAICIRNSVCSRHRNNWRTWSSALIAVCHIAQSAQEEPNPARMTHRLESESEARECLRAVPSSASLEGTRRKRRRRALAAHTRRWVGLTILLTFSDFREPFEWLLIGESITELEIDTHSGWLFSVCAPPLERSRWVFLAPTRSGVRFIATNNPRTIGSAPLQRAARVLFTNSFSLSAPPTPAASSRDEWESAVRDCARRSHEKARDLATEPNVYWFDRSGQRVCVRGSVVRSSAAAFYKHCFPSSSPLIGGTSGGVTSGLGVL